MAILITSFDGVVLAPDADYPNGQILDDPNGTRVNVKSNGDIFQFFQKLFIDAGITGNDLPDNVTNGYQYFDALQSAIQKIVAPVAINIIGNSYDTSKYYILYGMVASGFNVSAGAIFHNGAIYFCPGITSGSACFGSLVYVLSLAPEYVLTIACGTSGTGAVDYANLIPVGDSIETRSNLGGDTIKFTKNITILYSGTYISGTSFAFDYTNARPGTIITIQTTYSGGGGISITGGGTQLFMDVGIGLTGTSIILEIKYLGNLSGTDYYSLKKAT